MLDLVILIISIILQIIAAVIILKLIFISGKRLSWVMLSTALLLMVVRRILAFVSFTWIHNPEAIFYYRFAGDVIGLLISLLMVFGAICIVSIFSSLQHSEKDLINAKSELLEGKLLNDNIINTTIDGVLAVDEAGKVFFCNKQFVSMWQFPDLVINTRDSNKYIASAMNALKNPEKFIAQIREFHVNKNQKSRDEVEFKDGKVFDRYSSPLIDHNGVCYGRVWFFRDITDHKKAEAEIQNRLIYEGIISQIARRLSELSFFEIDAGINDSLGIIGRLIGVDRASIYLFAEDGKTAEKRYRWQTEEIASIEQKEIFEQNSFPLLNMVLTNVGSFQVQDVSELTDAWESEKKIWEEANVRSILCIPLYVEHKYIGFSCFDSIRKKISWNENQTSFLKTIGEIIAGLIRKKTGGQLEQLAQFDTLTGLANRYSFNLMLTRTIAFASRRKLSFALLLVDLDNFKKINDTLGHDVGDLLLKEVGVRLSSCIRTEDYVARVGGDEFFITLAGIQECQDACITAQRIIDSFNNEIRLNEQVVQITCSLGIACYPADGDTKEQLIKNADIAMYQAKNTGKNCYRMFSADRV